MFLLGNATAQENFVDGFILISQFDTVRGFINDKNYKKNSLYCDFRKTKTGATTRYFPSDIYGYRIDNAKYYISKAINIDATDTVYFLEYLIDGEMDFFFRQDEDKQNHFYVSKDSTQIYELRYSKEMTQIENQTYEWERKEFVGVLKFLTNDYPGFASEIESTIKPRHTNLVRLGEKYHNYVCKDRACIIYNKRSPFKFSVEISGGYMNGGYAKIPGNAYDYEKLDNSFYGLIVYVNNAEYNEKIQLGIGYINLGRYERVIKDWDGIIIDSAIFNQTKIPLIIGYSSIKKGFSPTLQTAVSINKIRKDIFSTVSLMPGIQYSLKNLYIRTYIEFDFISKLIIPWKYYSTNIGACLGVKF